MMASECQGNTSHTAKFGWLGQNVLTTGAMGQNQRKRCLQTLLPRSAIQHQSPCLRVQTNTITQYLAYQRTFECWKSRLMTLGCVISVRLMLLMTAVNAEVWIGNSMHGADLLMVCIHLGIATTKLLKRCVKPFVTLDTALQSY